MIKRRQKKEKEEENGKEKENVKTYNERKIMMKECKEVRRK